VRQKVEALVDGITDALLGVAWGSVLTVYQVVVKTADKVSPQKDMDFIVISTYTSTTYSIKAMRWVGKLLILVVCPLYEVFSEGNIATYPFPCLCRQIFVAD
jgi:hypothetical protein